MTKEKRKIKRIGETPIISEYEAYKYLYKSLSPIRKWKRHMNETYLRDHSEECQLVYHPLWLAETLVIANRPPFPPKKTPNMVFVDAVSGYRGVFSKIPPIQDCEVMLKDMVSMQIPDTDSVKKYVRDVQTKQINRSYILKKPGHEIRDIYPVYLPLWKIVIRSELVNGTFYMNANTGELETHMQKRWQDGRNLL
ncbi:hypothetical protein EU245_14115 [Lentibacillus lipolyticus]|nr:hypothetical protein EU245_14115 [Lentibacillus lipolyticus]